MNGLRLFGSYAAVSLVPIALLGVALGHQYRADTDRRALDQAASEAETITNAGIEPVVGGRDLAQPLTAGEREHLTAIMVPLLQSGSALRVRLRDRTGVVVFDAAHPNRPRLGETDDEVETAAEGHIVRKLTRLNSDGVDAARADGARAVEAYVPIHAGGSDHRVVGVLETYLPYAPIARSVAASTRTMLVLIVFGLAALWLSLSVITWSVSKKLRRSANRNEYLALHDPLTGLPNRALFADRAAQSAASAARSSHRVAIAIVDIDRFKEINDTLGHDNGDTCLRHIATTLAAHLRAGDTVARLGGDEFGLVLSGVDPSTTRTIVERIQAALAVDVELGGVPVTTEASIGIAYWPTDSTDIAEVLQHAELAMYTAKELRCGILEYDDSLSHYSPTRLALVSELRHAIENDELALFFQPKLDLRTNRIVSVEALLRWQHPERGLLLPAEFLGIAESTGLIDPLTDWVLQHALAQTAEWRQEGLTLAVAVNVSARNLRNESLASTVFAYLEAHDLPPAQLQIEITETALMADPPRAIAVLQQLHDGGVCVSLDDFGQGYTSLAQLGKLPLTELKIDRAFVANMITSAHDRSIVNTVIELAHNFGLEVVAEGVETDDILAALVAGACDTAQGWVLTPALPPAELKRWIANFEQKAAANA